MVPYACIWHALWHTENEIVKSPMWIWKIIQHIRKRFVHRPGSRASAPLHASVSHHDQQTRPSGFIPFAQFKQLLLRFVLVTITQWLVFEIILFTRFTYIYLVVWGIPQVIFPFTRVSQDSKPPKALTFRWTRVYHTKYHQHQYHSIIKIQ